MSDVRRVAVTCDVGHARLLIAAFVFLQDTDPGSPDCGAWAWRWDNEPALPKEGERSELGIPRWYGQPKRQVTRQAPDGTWQAVLVCPRCSRNVTRSWTAWTEALDTLNGAGMASVSLSVLDTANIGAKRGVGRS